MKSANLFAKGTATTLRNGKAKVFGLISGLMLAGAALTLATPAAGAQQFGVAVQFGGPRYVAPAPRFYPQYAGSYAPGYYGPAYVAPAPAYGYGPGYVERERIEPWRAHEYWEHHREYGRPVPYRGW